MNYFKPTYLYIKQHSITGKLYFGKTTKNPEKYNGSGTHWSRHIKKHGKEHVVNLWYCLFYDAETISEFALMFSKQQNIVESKEWLNKIPENGLDGCCPGAKHTNETKQKMSITRKGVPKTGKKAKGMPGKPLSEEVKLKISIVHKGVPKSEESKLKISLAKKGKPGPSQSAESKLKISLSKMGVPQPKHECPHCGKIGGVSAMKQWHFDNCKKLIK